ncbi:MAG: NAD-dependent epimerase/dehydratase family protein [Streptosporangiaceae bacterium]
MLLVTGATGYLGATLVALLTARGLPVRAIVRDPQRGDVLPDGVERVSADLDDEASIERAVEGCEGVFHMAAALSGGSLEDARRVNVRGTRHLLRAATRAGVRRVVHTSTSAAIIERSGLTSETARNATALADPYSITKTEAEGQVFAAVADGLDARIVNVTNAYGPSPRGAHSYNSLFAAAARGEVHEIVDARVGWVLAEDVALGHLLAYERGEPGRRYLLCGEVASFPQVLDTYAELVGSPHRVRALPPGTTLGDGAPQYAVRSEVYGKLGPTRVDDGQARALGFAPRGLDEGLRLTASWLAGGPAA